LALLSIALDQLDLRAGNEVTWAVARVRWWSVMARASED